MSSRRVLVCAALAWSAIVAGCIADPGGGAAGASKLSADDPGGESAEVPKGEPVYPDDAGPSRPGDPVYPSDAGPTDPGGCKKGIVSWKGCTSLTNLKELASAQCGAAPVSLEVIDDSCPAGEGAVAHFQCCPKPGGDPPPPPPPKCETIVIGPYDACLNDDLLRSKAVYACESTKRFVSEFSPNRDCSSSGSRGAKVVCCAPGSEPPPPPPSCEARKIESSEGCVSAAFLQDNAATRCVADGLSLGAFEADEACFAKGSLSAKYTCCKLGK